MAQKIDTSKLYNPTYIISVVKEVLDKCGIEYGTVSAHTKNELASVTYKEKDKVSKVRKLEPYKPIKMWYVDVDVVGEVTDDQADKAFIRLGYIVLDNELVNKHGYDITMNLN